MAAQDGMGLFASRTTIDGETRTAGSSDSERMSHENTSSVSTTSLVFERISERVEDEKRQRSVSRQRRANAGGPIIFDLDDNDPLKDESRTSDDLETGPFLAGNSALSGGRQMDRGLRRTLLIVAGLITAAWAIGLVVFVFTKANQHPLHTEHDPQATVLRGNGKAVTLEQVMSGFWFPRTKSISWIDGPNGEDGYLMERGAANKDYMVVEDVRARNPDGAGRAQDAPGVLRSWTLMRSNSFSYNGQVLSPDTALPSKDLKKILLSTEVKSNWRHSITAVYWIFDVESQAAEPLVPDAPQARVQLAQWSPTSDAVVFTRNNNMYLRRIGSKEVVQITKDGGSEMFNGVPDWVYEEEVLAGASATWFSEDGKFVAFLSINETGVPEYPIQYFVSRPSGTRPKPGEENYPEVHQIKYPKAGAHNPVVELKLFDVTRGDVFSVDISGGFEDDNRLIIEVLWAGQKLLIKETNRVSDRMRVVLVDVPTRTGKTVRNVDVMALDGGWFEISHNTRYIPAEPSRGRLSDGYIDTIIHDDGDHLAYFVPLDNPKPVILTSGPWEVDGGPQAIDLSRNLVYFIATKAASTQRHVYEVTLTGEGLAPVTDATVEGYYAMSFSSGAGYALQSYNGPGIPWQKVISTPSNPNKFEHTLEKNEELAERARKYELPIKVYGTLKVDGVELNYVERRPPHFNPKKKYPVLFHQYSGPGSQEVSKKFIVDYQSYVAAGLGYLVVTVDPRGTGYIGRKNRVAIRGELGKYEAHDHIAAAKHWASLPYVDASRIAIWGWSYGGYTTLKTLEVDAGQTFHYGMAVAPVTDWRFYDSIYTERYMMTPHTNSVGYDRTAVMNVTALGANVRFLMMHGVADDNVHLQNSLNFLDKLDLERVENYDVHVFPDSDHGISFHMANHIVYDKLTNWLVNAFNGEWLRVANAKPSGTKRRGLKVEDEA